MSLPVTRVPDDVPGLTYIPEFVTEQTERELVDIVNAQPWDTHTNMKRRTQNYGWLYKYTWRSASEYLGPLPAWAKCVAQRLVDEKLMDQLADQMIVNEYLPGQGIGPHTDSDIFGPQLVTISLGSDAEMEFLNSEQRKKRAILLQRRSCLVIQGEARYKWMHSIPAREADHGKFRRTRVSLTFRNKLTA